MPVTLAQATVVTRPCTNGTAMAPVQVTTGPGDVILILEGVGRVVAWRDAYQIDGGTALEPLVSYDEGEDGHLRLYAVTGLTPGLHQVDATNPPSGGSTARYLTCGIVVASGVDAAGLTSGAVHADISGGTSATKTWDTGAVPAGGAALGLVVSRRNADPASVSNLDLGRAYLDTAINNYASGAMHALLASEPVADETMTVTMGGSGAGGYIAITLAAAAGGETKTATATITLDLATTGAGSKHTATSAALSIDLATGTDPTKTGQSSAALAALLDLTGTASKTARSATSLSMLLGLDVSATKQAGAAAGIDLNLHLAAVSDLPPEHRTAAATLGLTLALDAIAGKTAAAGTTLPLALATHGDTSKAGVAHVDLDLILDTLAAAHKTGGAQAVLDLALAIAAAHHTPAGPTPPERTLVIAADDRTLTITAHVRTLTIDRQDRTLQIGAA